MNIAKSVNIGRLVTAYNLQIDNAMLPDNLKCVKCKLVLTDACQVPCGCRFCRACIDEMMASGSEFCPGLSEDCGESILSGFVTDYSSNKSISRLAVKCPQSGCVHGDHVRVCQGDGVTCPSHQRECQQDKLTTEEVSENFQQENLNHCEILIEMIADINREMQMQKKEIEMLRRNDEMTELEIEILKISNENSKREIEMLKRSYETSQRKIEMLKMNNENSKMEVKILKYDLVSKEEQIRTIIKQIGHVIIEIQLMKDEIKSIREEKADFDDSVQDLRNKIERDKAALIEHVAREITATTAVIGPNKDGVDTAIILVKDEYQSINEDSCKSIMDDVDSIKSQVQSILASSVVTTGLIDARCEWTIDDDIGETRWGWIWSDWPSEYFTGALYPYKYQLASGNSANSNGGGVLWILLHIHAGLSDAQLPWPFRGTVTITVTDTQRADVYQSITDQCKIRRPGDNKHSDSTPFAFSHFALSRAGVDLRRGVRVSCVIAPLFNLGR